jgi:cytochrome c peroxidase
LEEALQFYAQRDTNPGKWFPHDAGHVDTFNDLPPDVRHNVNDEPPFGRKPGGLPALSSAEIQDMIAFLNTLSDEDLVSPNERTVSSAAPAIVRAAPPFPR